jgi:hypothetical protein
MKLRLTVLLGAAFLLGVLAWAQAPATTAPSGELHPNAESAVSQQSATGKVISVSDTKLVVEVDSGAQMTFTLDSATAMMPAVKNLKTGDRVSVNYKSQSSGDLQVASVSLVTPPPESTTTTTTTTTTMPQPDTTATQPETPAPAQPDAVTAPAPDTTTQTRPATTYPSTAPTTSATPPSDSTTSQPDSYSTSAPTTTTDPNATSTSNALPQTASPLPVLFSLVILAALAAFTLRVARRQA